jgi:hypothetical protein
MASRPIKIKTGVVNRYGSRGSLSSGRLPLNHSHPRLLKDERSYRAEAEAQRIKVEELAGLTTEDTEWDLKNAVSSAKELSGGWELTGRRGPLRSAKSSPTRRR